MNHVDRASDLSVQWRKSSRSQQGAQCVEVGFSAEFSAVRDPKNPTGPALVLAPSAFAAMISSVKSGRFGLS